MGKVIRLERYLHLSAGKHLRPTSGGVVRFKKLIIWYADILSLGFVIVLIEAGGKDVCVFYYSRS